MVLPGSSDLYRIPVIGGTPRKLAAGGSDGDWSPDGRAIAFVINSGSPSAGSLYVVPAEGGEPRRIGRWPDRIAGPPRFSPDGKTIALPTLPVFAGGGGKIELVSTDGKRRQILPCRRPYEPSTSWSAQGNTLSSQDERGLRRDGWCGTSDRPRTPSGCR
jgi:Tol biopolymer transport system component